jgi:hypothetical protein
MNRWPPTGCRNHKVKIAALVMTPEGSQGVAFHSKGYDPEGVALYDRLTMCGYVFMRLCDPFRVGCQLC